MKGFKEVTLLGQNVNSYNDASGIGKDIEPGTNWELSDGFSSMCKVKTMGLRFADLLDRLSSEFPEMRFRYTSPHPKDFPDDCCILCEIDIISANAFNCLLNLETVKCFKECDVVIPERRTWIL